MPTTIDIESQRMFLGSTPVRKLYQGTTLLGMRITELFANGEQGVWYDPSDLSTLFQDAAGTTPVTAVEQPVGLMLDKSGRGNHASQPTATSRPVLSARVNLLEKTEQFDAAYWTKSNATVTANAIIAPDGTPTGDSLIVSAVAGEHGLARTNLGSTDVRVQNTLSIYVKNMGQSIVRLYIRNWATASSFVRCTFNLTDGSFSGLSIGGNGSSPSARIDHVGNGWYRCALSGIADSAAGTVRADVFVLDSSENESYTGDGTSGIYIWGADLRVANDGANLPPYQRVNTATDYDTVGFPHYLRFDGVDDWLVTNTITPGIDKVQVFAGVRKLSDAAFGMITELSTSLGTRPNTFYLAAPTGEKYEMASMGSIAVYLPSLAGSAPVPISSVLTGIGDISGDSAILRVNSAQVAQSTADQGAGNYLAYPLYIGRRGGTTLPFNGHLYSLIVRFGPNLLTATIEKTEKYINQKTRAY